MNTNDQPTPSADEEIATPRTDAVAKQPYGNVRSMHALAMRLERELAALQSEREELIRDKETFQRRLEKALQTIDELNDRYIEDNI